MEHKRRLASLIFLGSMVMTFVCVFAIKGKLSKLLTLIFVFAQFLSYIWYCLSYIPWGREICGGCIKRIFGVDLGLVANEVSQNATAVSNSADSV